jgi:dihydrofolate reductase
VASRTLTEVKWNATLLEGDVVDAVRKLKEQPGGAILKIGTGGSFSRTLLEHRLVDQYLFWLFPVITGSGARLYDGIETTDFDLIDVSGSTTASSASPTFRPLANVRST